MPELDGFGLLHELRSRAATRTIPIVMLSACAGDEAQVEGLERGADDYLIKPFAARELLARVGAHLSLSRSRKEVAESMRLVTETAIRKLAELSRDLMDVHERERAWLARELHDDVGQRVPGLTMQLHGMMQTSVGGSDEMRTAVAGCVPRVRCPGGGHSGDFPPDPFLEPRMLGLTSAAAALCNELAAKHAMTIELSEEGVPNQLPPGVAVGLFRVLQEALSNGIKHSGVRHLAVTLRGTSDDMWVEVADRGTGLDPELAIRGRGLGLVSMRERLGLMGGELRLESRPGAGTRIRARVPVRQGPRTP